MVESCFDDHSCQNFEGQDSLLILQRFPHLNSRNGDVEKVQRALQDRCSPRGQISVAASYEVRRLRRASTTARA